MSLLASSGAFPPIKATTSRDVSAEDRTTAIDFVNRVNFLFEEYDHDKMLSAFAPDAVAYHFHGTIRGAGEMRIFFAKDYPYLIPGVSRHATNHVVYRDQETGGVVVRYHMQLVRISWPEEAEKVTSGTASVTSSQALPQIWIFSPMMDRLKMTEDGWKINERYIGGSVTNETLNPSTTQPTVESQQRGVFRRFWRGFLLLSM